MPDELRFQVTLYPSPVLRREAQAVETFDEELAGIVQAMFERMTASQGVGLAAPQVGLKKRILVMNPTGEEADACSLINPTIVDKFGPETLYEEGCLSFPGIFAEIRRPESCTVRAFTTTGEELEQTFHGFPSRVVQHEYDHLEGVLLVDRMSPADKQKNKAALQELVDRYKRAKAKAATARR